MTKHLSLPENPTTAGCVDPRKAAKTTHVREVLRRYISRFRPRQAPFSDAARTRAHWSRCPPHQTRFEQPFYRVPPRGYGISNKYERDASFFIPSLATNIVGTAKDCL